MAAPPLDGISACVFDAYGTLFDYGAAAAKCRNLLGDKADRLTALWRQKQLEYTWLRTLQGRYADFWQVTGDALDFAVAILGIGTADLRWRLMESYLTLDPFPEVSEVLKRLDAAGMRMAILSNGSPAMLDAAVCGATIGGYLEAVLSVDEVGVYKTHPKVYELAVDRLGVAKGAIAYMSSNGWDAYAAAAFGMRVVWCNRYGHLPERMPGAPDREIRSLAELPALVLPNRAGDGV
ncbi:MAG TPA: haloacid dehalogenase type II [Stellaceae bacterium]|nr:haloacid dehalogenase type II [Stellaceae bacterium]